MLWRLKLSNWEFESKILMIAVYRDHSHELAKSSHKRQRYVTKHLGLERGFKLQHLLRHELQLFQEPGTTLPDGYNADPVIFQ